MKREGERFHCWMTSRSCRCIYTDKRGHSYKVRSSSRQLPWCHCRFPPPLHNFPSLEKCIGSTMQPPYAHNNSSCTPKWRSSELDDLFRLPIVQTLSLQIDDQMSPSRSLGIPQERIQERASPNSISNSSIPAILLSPRAPNRPHPQNPAQHSQQCHPTRQAPVSAAP